MGAIVFDCVILRVSFRVAAVVVQPVTIVPLPGVGYVAGEAPGAGADTDGRVTLDNVPGRAEVNLLKRSGFVFVAKQISRSDGTYRFSGLNLGETYDVIGRDPRGEWDDVIVGRVRPYAPPRITTPSLSFTFGNPATTQMAVQYGGAPFTWSADALPPGLSLSASGQWGGIPTAAGTTAVTVTVVDDFGESSSRAYSVTVT